MKSIWNGTNGNYTDAAKWDFGVPVGGDDGLIGAGTVEINAQSIMARNLTLDRGGLNPVVLNIHGGDPSDNIDGFASGLTVTTVGDGGAVNINVLGSVVALPFSNHGTIQDVFGVLNLGINGRTTMSNYGQISVVTAQGNSTLNLTVQSDNTLNTPNDLTTLVNLGVIGAEGGGFANSISLSLNGYATLDNKGLYEAKDKQSLLSITGGGKFQNDGTILINAGTLIDRAVIANNGLIADHGGQVGNYDGTITQTATGVIRIDNGGTADLGNTVGGVVDLNAGTLKFGIAGHAFNAPVELTGSTANFDFGMPVNFNFASASGVGTLEVHDQSQYNNILATIHLKGDYNSYDFATNGNLITYTAHAPAAPTLVGTVANEPLAAGSTIRPFATVRVTDSNYNYSAKVGATIAVLGANGKPTDANGLLSGTGLSKVGVGTYAINEEAPYPLQAALAGLVFTPTSVATGKTVTTNFDLTITDAKAGLSTEDKTTTVNVIGASPTLTAPLISGTWGTQIATPGTNFNPFLGVTVSDANVSPLDSAMLTVRGGGGALSGDGLTDAGNGVYRIAATSPKSLTNILNHLNFVGPDLAPGAPSVATNIQLDVTDAGQVAHDSQTLITDLSPQVAPPSPPNPPSNDPGNNPPVVGDPPPPVDHNPQQPPTGPSTDPSSGPVPDGSAPNCFTVVHTSTHVSATVSGDVYSGPVAGLLHQYINITHENLSITAITPSAFVHTGSGDDAIDVSKVNGTNVLDGSEGSNFLVGGSGKDTFFLDDRNAGGDIWSTVVGFHAGDDATIWGVTSKDFALSWLDNQGAAGFSGLTLGATESGKPNATLTLAGYTSADLKGGRLTIGFGHDGASNSDYMQIHGN